MSVAQRRRSERRLALTVVLLFLLVGAGWVLFTDIFLYKFEKNSVLAARLETVKGWAFVGLAALLLYLVSLRAASRLTRAHATTSAVLDSIGDGVLIYGRERTIVHANPAAVRMLGCKDESELVGMGAHEFSRRFLVSFPDGRLVPPELFVSQRVYDESGPLRYKAVLHSLDERELIVSVTAAAVRQEVGEAPDLVVSVMHDITIPEQLDRLRDQFFAAAAHTLKTPVAVIKANAQVLGQVLSPQFKGSTTAIDRQCGRIDRLVQNLFVVARVRSNTLRLHLAEVDLAPLVEQVAREMGSAHPRHPVNVEVFASAKVRADRERLAMVVRNLIDEAFRGSKSDAGVTILATQRDGEADIGIRHQPLPVEEGVVQRFEEYDDLAIGRQVVLTIIDALGGSIREETTAQGTTVWVGIPTSESRHAIE